MTVKKDKRELSTTRKTEYGYFVRKTVRHGKKRRQKTVLRKRNPEKVTLGYIGDVEFYTYPYEFPNKIFFGIYPLSTYIEAGQEEDILRIYNKVRWYFKEEWTKQRTSSKRANSRRRHIQRAYIAGEKRVEKLEKGQVSTN